MGCSTVQTYGNVHSHLDDVAQFNGRCIAACRREVAHAAEGHKPPCGQNFYCLGARHDAGPVIKGTAAHAFLYRKRKKTHLLRETQVGNAIPFSTFSPLSFFLLNAFANSLNHTKQHARMNEYHGDIKNKPAESSCVKRACVEGRTP